MVEMRRTALIVGFCVTLLGTADVCGQPGSTLRSDGVRLTHPRQLRKDVDLWPLIASPKTVAERKVNAILGRWNDQVGEDVRSCDQGLRDSGFSTSEGDGLNRTVTVRMNGPRFLSMVAEEGFFCGGAHPDGDTLALVFDLKTGELVRWNELNPAVSGSSAPADPEKGEPSLAVFVPGLLDSYRKDAGKDCTDAFEENQKFLLWPDAKKGALIAQASGLAHVDIPCVNEFALSAEQARALGFSSELLDAIKAAARKTKQAGSSGQRKGH